MSTERCRPGGSTLVLALGLLASATIDATAHAGERRGGRFGGIEHGQASYYGPGFHGRRTASGKRFDQRKLTAAHPALPFGTEVLVTNLENGKQVRVEVNDRGPFTGGRAIDLSKAAARKIGIGRDEGTAPVRIEIASR